MKWPLGLEQDSPLVSCWTGVDGYGSAFWEGRSQGGLWYEARIWWVCLGFGGLLIFAGVEPWRTGELGGGARGGRGGGRGGGRRGVYKDQSFEEEEEEEGAEMGAEGREGRGGRGGRGGHLDNRQKRVYR